LISPQPHAASSKHGAIHGVGVGVQGQRDGCHRRADADSGGLRAELPGAFPADALTFAHGDHRGVAAGLDRIAASSGTQLPLAVPVFSFAQIAPLLIIDYDGSR